MPSSLENNVVLAGQKGIIRDLAHGIMGIKLWKWLFKKASIFSSLNDLPCEYDSYVSTKNDVLMNFCVHFGLCVLWITCYFFVNNTMGFY